MTAEISPYVAVVYFHGMGQQRRYEESAHLIERLDQFLPTRRPPGRLREIEPRCEQDYLDPARVVTYVRAKYRCDSDASTEHVRFYEAYWAPATVGGTSSRKVVRWVLAQVNRPVRMLLSPWRSLERLRRADLIRFWRAEHRVDLRSRGAVRYLVDLYHRFFRLDARRDYPRGRFRDFLAFLSAELRRPPKGLDPGEVERLARGWRRSNVLRELLNLFFILTLLVSAAVALTLLAVIIQGGLELAFRNQPAWLAASPLSDRLDPSWTNVLAMLSFVLGILGVHRFLESHLGDVQQFSAYEETNELHQRRRVLLEQSSRVLRHVLDDKHCTRVVVIAHSLGCAVALDTLLDLRQLNQAHPDSNGNAMKGAVRLEKIRHLVTLASPIDKINYFFAVSQSRYHRYERIVDQLRGDLGQPPFCKSGRQPHVHWVNFWDRADVISGPIESVAPPLVREQDVDNVRVAMLRMPDPAESHTTYLEEPEVLERLCQAIFGNRHAFARRGRDGLRPDWWGPGRGDGLQTLGMGLLLLLPWLALGSVLEMLEVLPTDGIFSWLTLLDFVFVGSGMVLHKTRRGHVRRRKKDHNRRVAQPQRPPSSTEPPSETSPRSSGEAAGGSPPA